LLYFFVTSGVYGSTVCTYVFVGLKKKFIHLGMNVGEAIREYLQSEVGLLEDKQQKIFARRYQVSLKRPAL
jgi:hypothetical protein